MSIQNVHGILTIREEAPMKKGLPEWLKWLLLPITGPSIIIWLCLLALACLICVIVGKRNWAGAIIDWSFLSWETA